MAVSRRPWGSDLMTSDMRFRQRAIASSFFLCILIAAAFAQSAPGGSSGISAGTWTGSITLRHVDNSQGGASGPAYADVLSSIRLRLLPKGEGGLLDLADQSLFGYPLDSVSWTDKRVGFILGALGPGEDLAFNGFLTTQAGGGRAILGTAISTSWKGTFTLFPDASGGDPRETSLRVPTERGELAATLFTPKGADDRTPYVLFVSGAGATDRDGNNFSVPGRTDSLKILARELGDRGIGSLRYDKRGSGESYLLETAGSPSSLDLHARDAAAAYKRLAGVSGEGRRIVVGMNEGAWVAARALGPLAAEAAHLDGLVVIAASGVPPEETLAKSLESLSESERNEALAIVEAMKEKRPYPDPASSRLADFFSPARRDWLTSWLSFQPADEIAKLDAPVLYIYAGMDLQVSRADFARLLDKRIGSAAVLIPDMNYALKSVKNEEENYASFTDPRFGLPDALVSLLTAFVKAKPLPPGVEPFSR